MTKSATPATIVAARPTATPAAPLEPPLAVPEPAPEPTLGVDGAAETAGELSSPLLVGIGLLKSDDDVAIVAKPTAGGSKRYAL